MRSKVYCSRISIACTLALSASALVLAACGSDSSLLDSGPTSVSLTQPPPASSAPAGKQISRMVGFRPVVGPPDAVSTELTKQLNDAATEQGIALVIDPAAKPEHALRGYVTALAKGPAVSITYLWDVLDAGGKRVTRISGEEVLRDGVDSRQPWSAMTPAVARQIAQKTMGQLAQWAKAGATPVASSAGQPATPAALAPR